jgi:hypothetical protein
MRPFRRFYMAYFVPDIALFLVVFLCSITLTIRRLHDVNRSGWWVLIYAIPYLGLAVLFLWFSDKGTDGINRFGPSPLPVSDIHKISKLRRIHVLLFIVLLLIGVPLGLIFFSKPVTQEHTIPQTDKSSVQITP